MRFLLVLLALLSGLVSPEMARATRVQVAGMGAALPEEAVAAPQAQACLVSRATPLPSHPLRNRPNAPLPLAAVATACSIALTDRPLE
ncbi:hypothetical protein [Novosphingobium sp. Chol11]|uniref:hypothetical protein n=1 Tax=Novosphingobium sp. Chol11 TaxID=1385763 RepID=UPI0025F6BDD8|nr:hypothetical protein [Novosphingobium sp. Chol11]